MLPEPPEPPRTPKAGTERDLLCAHLDHQRAVLLRKVAGLTGEQLRSTPTASGLSLLGLLKHSAYVERWWFRRIFAGEDVTFPWSDEDPDADFRPDPEETPEAIATFYAEQVERSRAIVASSHLDDAALAPMGEDATLRGVLLHMIQEVARHLGHADVIREAIDGTRGN